MHYQPKLALARRPARRRRGARPLAAPALGCSPPEGFIPLAEQSNLIKPLTRWVLEEALRQCRGMAQARARPARRGEPLDADLLDPRPRASSFLLAAYGLPPRGSAARDHRDEARGRLRPGTAVLHELRALGVRIAIDDFGTGYSSLAQLQQLPADELKIDKSFVMDMDTNANNAAIVRSTIGLARNLGLEVTAEGVETRETRVLLEELGCDFVQGYLLGRPAPADACEREIRRHASSRRFARFGGPALRAAARGRPSRGRGPGMTVRRLACALAAVVGAGLGLPAAASAAEGDYVVVLRDTADTDAVVGSLERAQGFRASQRYGAAIRGFAVHLSDAQRERVLADPAVASVVADTPVQGTGFTPVAAKETVPTGVRRIGAATTTQAHTPGDVGVAGHRHGPRSRQRGPQRHERRQLRHAGHAGPGRQRARHAHRGHHSPAATRARASSGWRRARGSTRSRSSTRRRAARSPDCCAASTGSPATPVPSGSASST